jgi:hypothetical protein
MRRHQVPVKVQRASLVRGSASRLASGMWYLPSAVEMEGVYLAHSTQHTSVRSSTQHTSHIVAGS